MTSNHIIAPNRPKTVTNVLDVPCNFKLKVSYFLGEITEYELAYYGDDVSCRLNERNTCKRALCECDLEFARGLPDQIDSYSDDFHTYWSPDEYKWNPKEDCVKRKSRSFSISC